MALMFLLAGQGAAQQYLLGPGDVLDIAVLGESDLTASVTVRPDGKISMALIGEVAAVGLTAEQLQVKLTELLRTYLKDPRVTVTLKTARLLKVYLVGQVRSPGAYDMQPGWTVLEAITEAGGVTDKAYLSKATLIRRAQNQTIPLDLERLILRGDASANVALLEGDVIMVPEFQNRVMVLGNVRSPGAFDLKEGARVMDAIAAAGGPSERAALEAVGIIRTAAGGTSGVTTVDVDRTVKKGDQKGNIMVQNRDIVFVPESRKVFWADIIKWITDLAIVRAFLGAF